MDNRLREVEHSFMSFKKFINNKKVTRTATGTFVGAVKADPTFPEHITTWIPIKQYVLSKGMDDKAINGAKTLWFNYLRTCTY
jgi:hypothetical protein